MHRAVQQVAAAWPGPPIEPRGRPAAPPSPDLTGADFATRLEAWREACKTRMAALNARRQPGAFRRKAEVEAEPEVRAETAKPGPPRRSTKRPGNHLGDTHGPAKLTEADVRAIRLRHAGGEGRNDLANEFGVTARTINLIASRRRWTHLLD